MSRTKWILVGVLFAFIAGVSIAVAAWPALAAASLISVAMFVIASRVS